MIPKGAEFCLSVSRFQAHHLYNFSQCAALFQSIFHQTVPVVKRYNDQILVAVNNVLTFEDATRKTKLFFDFLYNVVKANIFYTEMHENEKETLNKLKFLEVFVQTYSERRMRDLWSWLTSPDLTSFTANLNKNMEFVNTNFGSQFCYTSTEFETEP